MKNIFILTCLIITFVNCKTLNCEHRTTDTEKAALSFDGNEKKSAGQNEKTVLLYEKDILKLELEDSLIYEDSQKKKKEKKQQKRFDVLYEILDRGAIFPIYRGALTKVIRNQKDFLDFLSLYGNVKNGNSIDFSKRAVVAICAGSFPTGGYGITFTSAIKEDKKLNLFFTVKQPQPEEIVTQAFTSPYIILSVEADSNTEIIIHTENVKSKYNAPVFE